jgi:hypothetical protein
VRKRDERDIAVEYRGDVTRLRALDRIGVDPPRRHVLASGQRLDHVAIGGEVAPVGDDRGASRSGVERGDTQLVEVDGRRVGRDDGAGRSADQRCDAVTDAAGQIDPMVPRPDELATPLAVKRLRDPLDRRDGQATERVAVEVHERRVVVHEPITERADRIGGVERLGVGAGRRAQAGFGSLGRPRARSPTMLRWISAVPPQIVSDRLKKNDDSIGETE